MQKNADERLRQDNGGKEHANTYSEYLAFLITKMQLNIFLFGYNIMNCH